MKSPNWLAVLGWVACLAVLAAIVGGLLMVGSPAQARREKADDERVADLEALTHGVRQYYTDNKVLPARQDQAYSRAPALLEDMKDPETGELYRYRVLDKTHFELCADFETDQSKEPRRDYYRYYEDTLPFWKHKAGRQCFELGAKSSNAGK